MRLDSMPLLFLDCQTTATHPSSGDVIELGWCLSSAEAIRTRGIDEAGVPIETSLLALPEGRFVNPTVHRITGLSNADFSEAPPPKQVWDRFLASLADLPEPVRCVIHYARFEKPFLDALHAREAAGRPLSLDIACTYQIARKLIPGLPSSTIRAVSGHFGRVLGEAHRAADHVRATLWIWSHLVGLLESSEGITEWNDLKVWLDQKAKTGRKGKTPRYYLMPREKRLALPHAPGVYRMLSRNGTLLYVGKATSLRDRVNSYFRTRITTRTRIPEMMAQVHDIDVTPVETPLEAALLETDEIKLGNPLYNASLRGRHTRLTFWSRDFLQIQAQPDAEHPQGPFPSLHTLEQLAALHDLLLTGEDTYGVLPHIENQGTLAQGIALFRQKHGLSGSGSLAAPELLNLGTWLPRRKSEEREIDEPEAQDAEWGPDDVVTGIESILRRSAQLAHRARWMCRLTECSLGWKHGDGGKLRWLAIQSGQIVARDYLASGNALPVPVDWRKPCLDRQRGFDVITFDRIAVLFSEIRRLLTEDADLELRLAPHIHFRADQLRRWLF